jgi:hypothetical protein
MSAERPIARIAPPRTATASWKKPRPSPGYTLPLTTIRSADSAGAGWDVLCHATPTAPHAMIAVALTMHKFIRRHASCRWWLLLP